MKTSGPANMLAAAIDRLLTAGAWAGSLAIWLIAAIVFYDVVMRFAGRPTLWALEISTYLMIGAAVLASGKAVTENAHFAVRLLPEALPPAPRGVLDTAVGLACLGLLGLVCFGFFQLASLSIRLDMTSPTLLHIPLWIPQGVTLAGFALMVLGFIRKLLPSTD